MKLKTLKIVTLTLVTVFFCEACSLFGTDSSDSILLGQAGTLSWGGSPAVDGSGILFKTEDETYGAPGTKGDYEDYFPEDESQVQIIADIELTGNKTTRGWGAEFPEIRFLKIKRVE